MPQSAIKTPEGLLLIANGIDKMLRWDGLTPEIQPAGLAPPTQTFTMSSLSGGTIVGTYFAYLRFVDKDGNFSNLSPIAGPFNAVNTFGYVNGASNTSPIIIFSPGHGLTTGSNVTISGVFGNTAANGNWQITVIDQDHFALTEVTGSNGQASTATLTLTDSGQPGSGGGSTTIGGKTYTAPAGTTRTFNITIPAISIGNGTFIPGSAMGQLNGIWSAGAGTINFIGVQVPTDPRVTRRQILRNTNGEADTFYVDVDTQDLTSTTLSSTNSDAILATNLAVPLLDESGGPLANQYTVPPSTKAVLAAHLGHIFATGEIEYDQGCVSVTYGSTTVNGVGTEWPDSTFNLRFLYVTGASQSYQISSVDRIKQVITLVNPYLDATSPYALYSIRPAEGERRLVYYTQAGLSEAWPATNAFAIQEDADRTVGLMSKGPALFILEQKHIYRLIFQTNPGLDGFVFLNANRGCVNNRCWVLVEDTAYMLDEGGAHAFSGQTEPISSAIQDVFEADDSSPHHTKINWQASQWFHAVHNPAQETIRWFVALSGQYLPRHALVYHYRTQRWWVEEFPFAIGSSTLGLLNGDPQIYLGGPGGKIYAMGQGRLDAVDATQGTLRGTPTGATPTSLSDTTAAFAADVVGSSLSISNGSGQGQQRRIVSIESNTRLNVDRPWLEQPDTTSTYQIGGIQWTYRSGWFRWAEDEEEHPRRLEIVFEPTIGPATMDARLYEDRSGNADVWQTDYTSDQMNSFSSAKGSTDLVADLTKAIGFVQRRIDFHREYYVDGRRFVQVEIGGVSNQDLVRIYSIGLDGAQGAKG